MNGRNEGKQRASLFRREKAQETMWRLCVRVSFQVRLGETF